MYVRKHVYLCVTVACLYVCYTSSIVQIETRFLRAGICRPYVETELTATKKSATDGN